MDLTSRVKNCEDRIKCLEDADKHFKEDIDKIKERETTYITINKLTIIINELKKEIITPQLICQYFDHIYLGQHRLNNHNNHFSFQFINHRKSLLRCIGGEISKKRKEEPKYVFINKFEIEGHIIRTYRITLKNIKGKVFIGCTTKHDLCDTGYEKGQKSNSAAYYGSDGILYAQWSEEE